MTDAITTQEIALETQNIAPLPLSITRQQAITKVTNLALPMALSYTFSFSILALTIMAGRIAENEEDEADCLAAAALISTMLTTVGMIAISSLYSLNISTSYTRGQLLALQESADAATKSADITLVRQDISRVLKNGVIMTLLITPPAMLALYFSKDILVGLGQDATVATLAQSYLRPYSLAILALLLRMCVEQVMFSFEKQLPAMFLGLLSFSVGTLLAYGLCFGELLLPKLGFAGIAYGYVIEGYLTCLFFSLYVARAQIFKDFNFFTDFTFSAADWKQIKHLFHIGLPIALTLSMEVTATLIVSLMAGLLGKNELVAWGFGTQFSFFALILLVALGAASCQAVSKALGEYKGLDASRLARYGLLTSVMLITPFCILVSAYPDILKFVMTNADINDEVMRLVTILVPITATGVAVDSVRYNILQILRAAGDHVIPTAIAIANTWLGVLLAYVLGFQTNLGIIGVGLGFTSGFITGVLALLPRWIHSLNTFATLLPPNGQEHAAAEDAISSQNVGMSEFSINRADESTPLLGDREKTLACPSLPRLKFC